jgi:hypothetical protein
MPVPSQGRYGFHPYFPHVFTIQLAFLPYF